MTLLTWPKTSSTGSSESTWARARTRKTWKKTNRNVFDSMNGSVLGSRGRTHLSDNAAALVEGDDGLGGFVVQIQPLLDGLLVVVRAAAGLAALHQPLDHGLRSGVHVQQQAGFADLQPERTDAAVLKPHRSHRGIAHLLLKLLALLHLTGVAINEEALGHVSLGDHGVFNHV